MKFDESRRMAVHRLLQRSTDDPSIEFEVSLTESEENSK